MRTVRGKKETKSRYCKMRHEKMKKRFGTFLGFTYLWSNNFVAARGHFTMIFVYTGKRG